AFLDSFNTLSHSATRKICGSDAHPKMIKKIKDRLASRMMSGMIAEIRPPDYETSREILRTKAEAVGNELPSEVLGYMAERLKEKSVREFESTLTAVTAVSTAYKKKINISLVREVLSGLSNNRRKKVRIEDIERSVSEHFKLSPEDLRSSKKKRSQVLPIHLCCYLARTLTGASYQEIGDYFGNRRHTTCIAATKKIEARIEKDSEFRDLVERLSDAARNVRI
ncbi:MAG: chromosomal replication initiator protein DnaA, partial [Planctomycetes bacterium]|nr:chromosomal replication initiator protein DnaA [Planctomycetota bacterium]